MTANKKKIICVIWCSDCSIAVFIMFLFLPFFGQKAGGIIQSVPLIYLTGTEPYLKAAYFAVVTVIALPGILTLALQNCRKSLWIKNKSKILLILNVFGAIIFIISSQPYAAIFLFVYLIIKGLMLIKRR